MYLHSDFERFDFRPGCAVTRARNGAKRWPSITTVGAAVGGRRKVRIPHTQRYDMPHGTLFEPRSQGVASRATLSHAGLFRPVDPQAEVEKRAFSYKQVMERGGTAARNGGLTSAPTSASELLTLFTI